jgi:hypothetical protein
MLIHRNLTLVPALLCGAHGDHDHRAETKAISVPAAPRAEATSDIFELMTAAHDGELTTYLDRFRFHRSLGSGGSF